MGGCQNVPTPVTARRASSYEDTRTDCDVSKLPAQAIPVLIVVGDAAGLGASRAVVRIQGSLQLGRAPDAPADQAWALDDDRASRRHALIEADARTGQACIRDLGSRNG